MGATHSPFQFDFSQLFQNTGHTTMAQSGTHTPPDMTRIKAMFEKAVGTQSHRQQSSGTGSHTLDLSNIFRSISQQFGGTQSRFH